VIGALAVGSACVERPGGGARPIDILAQVKARGILRVGVKADAPPFGWKDEFGYYGFDVDIARALAEELGIPKIDFSTVTSADRMDKVTSGDVDMVIASMTITRGREEKVDFTVPYFQDGQALMVRADSSVASYEDLGGKTVGAAKGATSIGNIKEAQPDCAVKEYPGYKEALAGLRAGEVDAITSDMLILMGLKLGAEKPEAYRIAGGRFSTEPYGIAVRENQSEFRDALNAGIERLWKTGRWQRVYEDWFGKNAKYRADEGFKIVPFPE
jgi:polar amino acid transport system substrate-binding protein